jgi:hypothetical protein
MSPRAFLSRLVSLLREADVPFMVTGSLASTAYGEPRATRDVDIVIDPAPAGLDALISLLRPEFYVSADAARDALRERGMFNVIHLETGWKVDLIVRKDRPFSREEFARRRPAHLFGSDVFVVSPEDSLLSKLEWAQKGGSEQQLRDAAGIAARTPLDSAYLHRQAAALGITDLLERVLSGSRP